MPVEIRENMGRLESTIKIRTSRQFTNRILENFSTGLLPVKLDQGTQLLRDSRGLADQLPGPRTGTHTQRRRIRHGGASAHIIPLFGDTFFKDISAEDEKRNILNMKRNIFLIENEIKF